MIKKPACKFWATERTSGSFTVPKRGGLISLPSYLIKITTKYQVKTRVNVLRHEAKWAQNMLVLDQQHYKQVDKLCIHSLNFLKPLSTNNNITTVSLKIIKVSYAMPASRGSYFSSWHTKSASSFIKKTFKIWHLPSVNHHSLSHVTVSI